MPRRSDRATKNPDVHLQRHQDLDTYRLMSLLPVLPYHVVADIGCGPGNFAIALGKHVFDGKVYAIDGDQAMLDTLKAAQERIRLTNVEPLLSRGDRLPLDDESLDGAVATFVLHEAGQPKALLAETLRCLRRGGWFALLEWDKRVLEQGPPLESRIDEAELKKIAQEVGFRLTARHSCDNNQFMMLMRK